MYLGLDLGTSGVKALLIDEKQSVIASGTGTLDISRPHSGWSPCPHRLPGFESVPRPDSR